MCHYHYRVSVSGLPRRTESREAYNRQDPTPRDDVIIRVDLPKLSIPWNLLMAVYSTDDWTRLEEWNEVANNLVHTLPSGPRSPCPARSCLYWVLCVLFPQITYTYIINTALPAANSANVPENPKLIFLLGLSVMKGHNQNQNFSYIHTVTDQ